MKKALFLCLIAAGSMSIFATPLHAATDISAKILKEFHTHFPEVANPTIYHSGDTYTVSFRNSKNNTSGRIYYDSDGNVLETIRYYSEKELSPFIRSKIQSKYKDKSIFMVTDVENDSEHYYQVILENQNSLLVVHVNDNGSMHLEKKYKKAA
jgi:hypothetical protein